MLGKEAFARRSSLTWPTCACDTPAGVPGPATNGSGGGAGGSTAEGARLRDAQVTHKVTTAEEYAEAKDAMVRLLYCLDSLA